MQMPVGGCLVSRSSITRFYLLVFLFCVCPFVGAEVTAGVLGTVVDPSGAIVANANLTLTNNDTGLVRHARSDSSGNFEFLSVPIGENYSLEVDAAGFQKSTQTGIKLLVNQKY